MAELLKCLDGDYETDSLDSAIHHSTLTGHTLTTTTAHGNTVTIGPDLEDDEDEGHYWDPEAEE